MMEPDTLETILKITGIAGGVLATAGGVTIFSDAVSKYNVNKRTYNEWTNMAEQTGNQEFKDYVKKMQDELIRMTFIKDNLLCGNYQGVDEQGKLYETNKKSNLRIVG